MVWAKTSVEKAGFPCGSSNFTVGGPTPRFSFPTVYQISLSSQTNSFTYFTAERLALEVCRSDYDITSLNYSKLNLREAVHCYFALYTVSSRSQYWQDFSPLNNCVGGFAPSILFSLRCKHEAIFSSNQIPRPSSPKNDSTDPQNLFIADICKDTRLKAYI